MQTCPEEQPPSLQPLLQALAKPMAKIAETRTTYRLIAAEVSRSPTATGEARYTQGTMSTKELIEAALKLDPVERAQLADTIWQSLSESEIEAIEDAEDVVEARASLARMKEDREQPIPWEDVKKQLGLG